MKKPNFFIIGAPKSGTTALSEYLRQHPGVFFSTPKEPHYFNEDYANRYTRSFQDYLDLFACADARHSAVGEGSVFYLSSAVAVSRILEFNERARFIVLIRNPVEAAHSFHSQAVYSFGENVLDFAKAWHLQEPRLGGESVPRYCQEIKTLLYGPLFEIGRQLKHVYRFVPRERVKVIMFDEFVSQTRRTYEAVLQFLRLPPNEATTFPKVNANKQFRFWKLERMLRAAAAAKQSLGIRQPLGVRQKLKEWNTQQQDRPALSEEMTDELRNYFRSDIEKLSQVLGRDLTGWLDKSAGAYKEKAVEGAS